MTTALALIGLPAGREGLTFRGNGKSVKDNEERPLFESCGNNNAGQRITRSLRWIIKEKL